MNPLYHHNIVTSRFCMLLSICVCILLSGCTQTNSPNTEYNRLVLDVPFEKQLNNYSCGACAASIVMEYYGKPVSQFDIAHALLSKKRKGILTIDINMFLREHGLWTKTIRLGEYTTKEEKENLLRARISMLQTYLDRKHPVIVLLGPKPRDICGFHVRVIIPPLIYISDKEEKMNYLHYVVLTGYDRRKQVFLAHNGYNADINIPFEEFTQRWRDSGYWGVLAVHPEHIRLKLSAEDALAVGVYLEQRERYDESLQMYRRAYTKAGQNSDQGLINNILFNQANVHIAQKRYEKAEKILLELQKKKYHTSAVRNNLAVIYLESGTQEEKEHRIADMIQRAIQEDKANAVYYYDTYGLLLLEKGAYKEAEKIFKTIIEGNHPQAVTSVAWYHYGRSLEARKKYAEACTAYEQAMNLVDEEQEPTRESRYTLAYTKCGLHIREQIRFVHLLQKIVALNHGEYGWEAKEILNSLTIE